MNGQNTDRCGWDDYTVEDLEEFTAHQRAVHHLIDHHKDLLDRYPDQWIGVWVSEDDVPSFVNGDSVEDIVRKAQDRELPLKRSYIRYMDTRPRIFR
ncbi:MAG: hypothetical protein OXH96_14200 [Spirochaetaceae bacterium]|nr:hypothetical protein [Spirochaetaceae bacterium]